MGKRKEGGGRREVREDGREKGGEGRGGKGREEGERREGGERWKGVDVEKKLRTGVAPLTDSRMVRGQQALNS